MADAPVWKKPIRFVTDGEPVSAPVTNRPVRDAQANLDALRERVEGAATGSRLVAFAVSVDASAPVGCPVVLEGDTYVPSSLDPAGGRFRVDGVVRAKLTSTTGDVTLGGQDEIDLTAVTDDTASGVYYLGPADGRLTASPPTWAVPVLVKGDDGSVLVFGGRAGQETAHTHQAVYAQHRRSDGSDPGWQDASAHPVGRPSGAAYRYVNSAAVDRLVALAVPGTTFSVTQFDGYGRGTELDDTVVQLTPGGLWWLGEFAPGDATESTSSASGGPMRLRLSAYASPYSVGAVVRSLTAPAGGPIVVENCDGTADPYGNLRVRYDGAAAVSSTTDPGATAFKAYEDDGTVAAGPVVSGLRAADGTIVLSGGSLVAVDPDDPSAGQMRAGAVLVRANLSPDGRVVLAQTVRLDDLRQRDLNGLYYLAMPADRTSSAVIKFRLPGPDAVTAGMTFTISLLLLAETTGSLPPVTVSYKRLPRPAVAASETPPASFTAVTFSSSGTAVVSGDYARVDSAAIAGVEADDVIVVKIVRSAPDAYAGEVGLFDLTGFLTAP